MAQIDHSVVKSYDIRGIFPDQIDAQFAFLLGKALPRVLRAQTAAVGRDARLSSARLYAALAAGLREAGVRVETLGLCPTELVYYALGEEAGFDLGVMVTASHNPPDYNGFKVVKGGGEPVTGETGLDEACRLMEEMDERAPEELTSPETSLSPWNDYMDFVLGLAGAPDAEDLDVVVDAGNGVGGLLWERVTGRVGLEPTKLNFQPDGEFPGHLPDPTKPENLRPLLDAVGESGADLGFCYDGDADRVVVVLRDGHVIDGSEMTACIARRLLEETPEGAVGCGQTMSRKALDHLRSRGTEPVITPVGHAKIKRVLRSRPGMIFAGENAGHYYYRDFFCCDSSLLTTLYLLQLAAEDRLVALVDSLPGPWHRPDRQPSVEFDDQEHALEVCRRVALKALGAHPGPDEISCERGGEVERNCSPEAIQGAQSVRADYPDWWFCVRPSGTEPVARLAAEARSKGGMRRRVEWLLQAFESES